MLKKKYFLLSLLVLLILVSSFFIYKKLTIPKKTHIHAGFVVLKDNKKLDFSDLKYMKVEPCVVTPNEDEKETDETIQQEKAHLHDFVGNLVHIEREGATWRDLFINIHYPLSFDHTTGYINGKKVADYQQKIIMPYDSLVVFIGNTDPIHLKDGVTKDYIRTQEKKSRGCSDR